MCTRKIKIRSLLLFLLSVACLCAGLLFSAPNGGSASIDGVFHEIGAGGQTYLLCLDGGTAEISDLHYKELCRYDIGDGTVIMSRCISDLDRDGTDEILLITGPDGSEYGTELLILTLKAGGTGEQTDARDFPVHDTDNISLDVIYKRDMADINPWKVQTREGWDGRTEISVGGTKRPCSIPSWQNGLSYTSGMERHIAEVAWFEAFRAF